MNRGQRIRLVWISIFVTILLFLVFSLVCVYRDGAMATASWIILFSFIHIPFFVYATIRIIFSAAYQITRYQVPMSRQNPSSVVVIIPVRNDQSVFWALPDVLKMDYPNFRICIVDDSDDISFLERLQTLTSEKVTVLHREKKVGGKAGAINYVLDWLKQSSLEPEFVAVFDADHHPPPDFLTKAVSVAKETGKPIIAGWQPHEIGDDDLFGSFIRLSWTAAAIDLTARAKLGFAPIFGGSGGLFNFRWLDSVRFDEGSITEDWKISLRAYLREGDQPIVFRRDLWVVGHVPQGFRWYVKQQIRWAEGTFRDFRQTLWNIITSSNISFRTKLGLCYHGLIWAQSFLLLISLGLLWGWIIGIGSLSIPLWITVVLLAYYEVGWITTFILGTRVEKFSFSRTIKLLFFVHVVLYLMCPIYAYATIRGLALERGPWHITRKREGTNQ